MATRIPRLPSLHTPIGLLALAGSVIAAPTLTFAGVVLEYEHISPGQDAGKTNTAYVEKDRFKMDTSTSDVVFRADKQLLWLIKPNEGTYYEVTKETLKKQGDQAERAKQAMQEQIKNLPPEKRAMAEQMMGKMAGVPSSEPRTYVKTSKSETINGFPCVSYDAMRGSRREQELWVTDWSHANLSLDDLKIFETMSDFFKDAGPLASQISSSFQQRYGEAGKPGVLPGFPIRVVTFSALGESKTEVKKITHQEIAAGTFDIPAKLKKTELPHAGS